MVIGCASGRVRINAREIAAKRLVAPRLGRFHLAQPDVVLEIVIDAGLSEIAGGRFGAGIRVGERL